MMYRSTLDRHGAWGGKSQHLRAKFKRSKQVTWTRHLSLLSESGRHPSRRIVPSPPRLTPNPYEANNAPHNRNQSYDRGEDEVNVSIIRFDVKLYTNVSVVY